jgi:hypothetical protein
VPADVDIYPDAGTAQANSTSVSAPVTADGNTISARVDSPSSEPSFIVQIHLSTPESVIQLADGSVAVVAPWPADVTGPDDGSDYTSPSMDPGESDGTVAQAQPAAPDPYDVSADPGGSMAADEASHNVGPFDPAYSEEYTPDTGADSPTDPDTPQNANAGLPPPTDTTDTTDASDDESVAEPNGMDALYSAEELRSDQILGLLGTPTATDSAGHAVPASFSVTTSGRIYLDLAPTASSSYPLVATSAISFNPDADNATSAQTLAAASNLPRCSNHARDLVYTERGNGSLVRALAHRPGTSVCHYITLEPSQDASGRWVRWPQARVAFIHNKNTTAVTGHGSKFVAVARVDWEKNHLSDAGVDPYAVGKLIRQNMYLAGFRPGTPYEDTWAVNEIPASVFTSSATRNRLIRLVHGLYFGPRGFRKTAGFVFKTYAHHDDAYPYGGVAAYKTKWESLLQRTSFWQPDTVPSTTSASIAPYVRWWAEETYTFCWLVCVPGAKFDGTTSPPGNTKTHKTNEYIEHPARLAFAGPSSAGEARRLFDHGYMPLINTFWTDTNGDPTWQTGYLQKTTMQRFASLQIYAARRWSDSHAYPDRRIAIAWSERAKPLQLRRILAARLATSIAGGYSPGSTALDVCPRRSKVNCNPSLNATEQSHYPPAHFIPDWDTFKTW